MASSTHDRSHGSAPCRGGNTAAPPPTPSTQSHPLSSSSSAADVLSHLLLRLPPTLSLPTRRRSPPPTTTTPVPLISLSSGATLISSELFSAASQLGFFQLTDHSIPSQLACSAESESLSLLSLSREQKQLRFPQNWPLGFDSDEDDHENGANESICFDSSCFTESTESLFELSRELDKVGLQILDALSCAMGFESPVQEDPTRLCSLMWVFKGGSSGDEPVIPVRTYPYIIGLAYQIRCRRLSLHADSGWVTVSPRIDSVLVTLGDIAQVWSNGKTKKVRGRPIPTISGNNNNNNCAENGNCISMTMLLTLPIESIVSPRLPLTPKTVEGDGDDQIADVGGDTPAFDPFSFEDYAWRVYYEQLQLKDPLDRYRRV